MTTTQKIIVVIGSVVILLAIGVLSFEIVTSDSEPDRETAHSNQISQPTIPQPPQTTPQLIQAPEGIPHQDMTPEQVVALFLSYYYQTVAPDPSDQLIEQADQLLSEKAQELTIGTNGARRMSMLVGIPNPADIDTFPIGPTRYESESETDDSKEMAYVPVTLQFDKDTTATRTFVLRKIDGRWMIEWVEMD